jgi:hypothetical protein
MGSYTVTATITFDVTNPSALRAVASLAGTTSGDEPTLVDAVVRSGLQQLPKVADRYGFIISASDATVEPVED